jgi:aminopeptidase N
MQVTPRANERQAFMSSKMYVYCGFVGLWLLVCGAWSSDTTGTEERWSCGSAKRAAPTEGGQEVPRRYAPDRRVDVRHVRIDVTPDFASRTVHGVTAITFTPIVEPLKELRLDAIDLDVLAVESQVKIAGYTTTDKAIIVSFDPPIPAGEPATVTIAYDAEPQKGLYFRTPSMGYPESDVHLFTQGESHEAPYWYPSFDYPNERFTTEVTCRVPREMTVVSNGRLVSEEIDPATGLKAVHWRQDKPHVNYLVALVAGKFGKLEARCHDIPLAFYTPPSQIQQAASSFQDTADMIEFFEREIGVPFPWDKYDQAVGDDFMAGGMENTSLTILSDRTLFTAATENIRSSENLISHELAHQWFGDYVTCKDWSHIWLNEGFATYYATLYNGHHNGRDDMLYELYRTARRVTSGSDDKAVVDRRYEDAEDQFDYRAYSKGGWVLHMLRCQLGETLYRQVVKTYLERHALGTAVTEDLRSAAEELSGQSFDRFFDQWLYHPGCPKLDVAYEWSQTDKLAKITVKQTCETGGATDPFLLPTKVRFRLGDQVVDRGIVIDSAHHDFYFALAREPNVVRFDPELTLLAQVTFDKRRDMLYAQLADESDVVGRLLAVAALKEKKDTKTVAKLQDALDRDPFYGVRCEAASALREIHTDEAFDALVASRQQNDARVRLQVVREIGEFYRTQVPALMQTLLADEKNPEILMAAIESLGRFQSPETHETLCRYLQSSSYRNELAGAAIEAVRSLDDPTFIPDLMTSLRENERQFQSRKFGEGLDTLAHIAREQEDRTQVREFIAGYVNHPRQAIRGGAIAALGTLGDPGAIPIVETFCVEKPHDRIQRQAKEAMDKLREKKPLVPEEVIELRKTVDELKKDTDKLKEQIEDLKKQNQAKEQGPPTAETQTDPNVQ